MSDNTFGKIFRVTTWGESHGPALGCIVDGCPPGLPLSPALIQARLDERRPGTSRFVTQRREADAVEILSGVFEDERMSSPLTTGTPISLLIRNTDQRSKDYDDIRDKYRPGHADFTYQAKYGLRDYRGGGRASARETAARVAAGAVAAQVLQHLYHDTIRIEAGVIQMGPHKASPSRFDWNSVKDNAFWCPDPHAAQEWAQHLDAARKAGSSMGAIIQITIRGIPAGLGAPLYGKLDADLAAAIVSINAVKAIEFGEGMGVAALSGEQNADEMQMGAQGAVAFTSNHAGGILGGIASGQDIVLRFAVKPTSSILTPRKTITKSGDDTHITTKGRHDPCVGIRAVPVAIAMVACTLADHALRHRAQTGRLGDALEEQSQE